MSTLHHGKKLLVKRFSKLPITLYRIQAQLPVRLESYNVIRTDGLVHPALGDTEFGRNGMSLRPGNETMWNIIKNWKGNATVYRFGEKDWYITHRTHCHTNERDDHDSLQTTEPITLDIFNQRLTQFLEALPNQTKEQFIAQMEDYDDQDN